MNSTEELHRAEKTLFCSAGRFAKSVKKGDFAKAGAITASVSAGFTGLAHAAEAKIFNSIQGELDKIHVLVADTQSAVEQGAADAAMYAYAEMLLFVPEAHERVASALKFMADGDPGSRGGETENLTIAAERALVAMGLQ